MNELSTTPHGRLLSAAMALSLIGGGIAALLGGSIAAMAASPLCVGILCVSLLGATALSLIAVALSIGSSPWFGFIGVIVLPVALFLYWIGLQLAVESGATWGIWGFIGLGVFIGVNALRVKSAGEPAEERQAAPAH
jgi:hypothetical protein